MNVGYLWTLVSPAVFSSSLKPLSSVTMLSVDKPEQVKLAILPHTWGQISIQSYKKTVCFHPFLFMCSCNYHIWKSQRINKNNMRQSILETILGIHNNNGHISITFWFTIVWGLSRFLLQWFNSIWPTVYLNIAITIVDGNTHFLFNIFWKFGLNGIRFEPFEWKTTYGAKSKFIVFIVFSKELQKSFCKGLSNRENVCSYTSVKWPTPKSCYIKKKQLQFHL